MVSILGIISNIYIFNIMWSVAYTTGQQRIDFTRTNFNTSPAILFNVRWFIYIYIYPTILITPVLHWNIKINCCFQLPILVNATDNKIKRNAMTISFYLLLSSIQTVWCRNPISQLNITSQIKFSVSFLFVFYDRFYRVLPKVCEIGY